MPIMPKFLQKISIDIYCLGFTIVREEGKFAAKKKKVKRSSKWFKLVVCHSLSHFRFKDVNTYNYAFFLFFFFFWQEEGRGGGVKMENSIELSQNSVNSY